MKALYSATALCLLVGGSLWIPCSGQLLGQVTVEATGDPVNSSDVTLTCSYTPSDSSDAMYIWERFDGTDEESSSGASSASSASGIDSSGSRLLPLDGGSSPDMMMNNDGFIFFNASQNLTFSPFVFGNEGVYRCIFSDLSSLEMVSSPPYTLSISPEGSVSVSANPDQSLYDTNDDITLNCSAQGGPMNIFQWKRNDVNLTNETSNILNISGGDGGGVYICVVSNDAGSDMDNFTVNVYPTITQQPVGYNAEVSTYRSLECNATGFPVPTYQWFKVGGELNDSVSGENTSVLRFNPVQYGDEGDYYCQVTSGDNIINSTNVTVTISTRGTVAITPVNGSLAVGENGTLTCSARGGPRNMFQWYREGMELQGENSSVLILTNITLEDGVEYVCEVSNSAGTFNTTTFVLIEPSITEHPEDTAVTNGTNVTLKCRAEAFPDPVYEWTHSNGSAIDLDIVVETETDTLRFVPAVFGSEGGYVCTATANNITAKSNVAILYLSPENAVTITPQNTTVSTGDNVTLTCSALGGPNNTFSWEFEAMSINVTTASLQISDISVSEGGDYMCRVSNVAGDGFTTATVFIQPIITSAEDILTTNGSSIEFVCEAEGIPSPNVTWERIEDGRNRTVSVNSTYGTTVVQFGDEGDYQCVAKSDAGNTSQIATLTISPEGSVEAAPRDVSSGRGVNQTFTCSAMGGPGNNFTWTRLLDNETVSQMSNLTVQVVDASSGSEYRCEVENEAGSETDDVILRVAVAVDTHPQTSNVSINDDFTLSCTASAFPLPNITWLRNSSLVEEDNRTTISQRTPTLRTVTSTITIEMANTTDGGTYVCRVGAPRGTDFNTTDSNAALVLVQDTPERPRSVEGVNITSRSIILQWVEPHDSNAPILGYRVMYMTFPNGTQVVLNATDTFLEITDLHPGVTYNFTVVAFNEIGSSPPSDVGAVRTLDEAPSNHPQNLMALTRTSTAIEAQWAMVPLSQRNGNITFYELEVNQTTFEPSSVLNRTNGPELVLLLSGLEEFVEYTLRVRAYTSAGAGPFSPPVSNQTLTDRPARAPENVSVSVLSSTEIEVSWEEVPAIDQNGVITVYEVQFVPLETFNGTISTNSVNITNTSMMSTVLTGLEEFVQYNISVRAYTSTGPGPYSGPVSNRTETDNPAAAPEAVMVTVMSSTEFLVSWMEVPDIDQNGEIIVYEIQYTPFVTFGGQIPTKTANTTGPSLMMVLMDLEEYVEYNISVRAYTSTGPGPYSDPVSNRTLEDEPDDSPQNVSATAVSSTEIEVSWEEVPAIDQNGVITMYEVQFEPLQTFNGAISTNSVNITNTSMMSTVLTGLEEYVQYNISVRAYTSTGPGPYSAGIVERTDTDEPAEPPRNVMATAVSSTEIEVSWEEVPAIDQNGVITMYEVQFEPLETFNGAISTNSVNITNTSMMSTVLTGLEEYVEYNISVRAYTSTGPGPYSAGIVERTDTDVPDAPPQDVVTMVTSSTAIAVFWGEVPEINRNGILTIYEVLFEPLETFNGQISTNSVNITNTSMMYTVLTGLEEYVEYSISVRAYTSTGPGPYSDPVSNRTDTDEPAEPPQNVMATAVSSTEIEVSWEEVPAIDQNGVITVYEVQFEPLETFNGAISTNSVNITNTSMMSTVLTGLEEYVQYNISVRAYTSTGPGPFSTGIVERTDTDVPDAPPQDVVTMVTSSTAITVFWGEVPEINRNGILTMYGVLFDPLETFNGQISTNSVNITNTSMLSIVLTGLEEYVEYSISVRAYTSTGPGPYSDPVSNRTDTDEPAEPPQNVMATAVSSTEIEVSWEEVPAIDQNGVITVYEVQFVPLETFNGQISTNITNTSMMSTVLTGLEEFVEYNISVRAYTSTGPGPYSGPVSNRTLEDEPASPPPDLTIGNITSTTIMLTWLEVPAIDQNGVITQYEVEYSSTTVDSIATTRTKIVTTTMAVLIGLEEYVEYFIRVRAYTVAGPGPYTDERNVTTDQDIPGDILQPPPVSSGNITTTTALISWAPPPDRNGIIISYTVRYIAVSMASGMQQGRRRRQTGREVLPECVTGGQGNIDRTEEVPGDMTQLQLDQLTPFLRYEFSVQPETRVGRGNFSVPRSFETAESVPTAPRSLTVWYLSSMSLEVEWEPPQCDFGIRTGYMLEHMASQNHEPQGTLATNIPSPYQDPDPDRTSIVLEGLSPNTNYSVTLCALTSTGCGATAGYINQTNEDAPMSISNLVIESSRDPALDHEVRLDISWTPPSTRNGIFRTLLTFSGSQTPDYPPQRSNSSKSMTETLAEDAEAYVIRRALPYAEYNVTVQPFNVKTGNRAPSVSRTRRTIAIEPTVAIALSAEGVTSTSIRVSWDLPKYPNAPITGYFVYYLKISDDTGRIEANPSSAMRDPNDITIDGYSLKSVSTTETVLDDLEVYRYYSIIVRAVGVADSGAELSGALAEVVNRTFSDFPTEEPSIIVPGGDSRNTITISLPDHTYIDSGEVIFYAVIVIRGVMENMKQTDYDDAQAYLPETTYYITAAWSRENVTRVPSSFIIGDESVTYANGVKYVNAKLKSGSSYSFFVTIDLQSDIEGEVHRIRTDFTTAETDEIPPNPAGPAAGGVIAVLVAIAIVILVVAAILYLRRRSRSKELDILRSELAMNDLAGSIGPVKPTGQVIANLIAQPYKATLEPIPVREFPSHVMHLHANDDFLFSEEYSAVEPDHAPTSEVCSRPENQSMNRYANIKAYDHSRVHLMTNDPGNNYINANRIDGYRQENAFIATQGPVPASIPDFWMMVWEQGTATIVMLTNLEEKGKIKCHKYWPDEQERTKVYDTIHIRFHESLVLAEYTVRTFSLQMDNCREERIVKQFHYTVWPDHGVPEYPTPLLQFVRKVTSSNPMNAGPIIVHCSAGVGRTGTFITLDAQLKRIRKEQNIDVFRFVRNMRKRRCYMVQTEHQYIFIHDALLEAIECGVTEVAARDLNSQHRKLCEADPATRKTGMEKLFLKLDVTLHCRERKTTSTLPVNLTKNRYTDRDMLPFDKNRCRLKSIPGAQGSDYINATYIDGYHRIKEFIATQGPLPDTENDFWRMVWEQKSSTIIMLTKEKEGDGTVKCHTYWPKSGAGQYDYLQVILHNTTSYPDYTLREFNIVDTRDESSLPVKQFQFTDWPEESVPASGSGLIDLIGQVQKWQRSSGDRPVIVHCSGGCGRTGTYIAVSILIERLKTEGVVDVFQTVRKLRLQRPGMVASVNQYDFCYKTLLEFLDSFELYANFK